ncbi:sugar transferase [Symbiobacterium thermophilum]|uniref:Sugar transferase n=1 Tax=Symbiobacterium thermophilum TaxID=2734 RepID=A0A953LEK3_SYMTR|nr:sugar transferase [Symbiobacterium thermophilum]MBY6276605.1 sugar transferase [Symbiobacterium thermophilum]
MRRSWFWTALFDVCLLIVAITVAFWWRFGWPPPQPNLEPLPVVLPIVIVALPLTFYGLGLYLRRPIKAIVRSAIYAEVLLFLIALAAAFWMRGFAFPRSVLLLAFAVHFVGALGWRLIVEARTGKQRVAVVAPLSEATQIVQKLLHEPVGWYDIVRVLEPDQLLSDGISALTGVELVVLGPSVVGDLRLELLRIAVLANARVYVMPEFRDILIVGSVTTQIGDTPVFEIRPLSLTTSQRIAKRAFDLLLAIPMLVLLSPIMLLTALIIKVSSPGPVLYAQKRVGQYGKEFVLYKFRTMVVDAEKETGPVLASARDPRVTPVGRFLRATRIDEIPQLINVIRGEMSLVGPRPERRFFVDQYCKETPDYDFRHLVLPGITGLAQVMGRYCTSVADKLRFDLYYIRHYSIWMDFKILLLTLQAVISKDGSQGIDTDDELRIAARAEELVLGRAWKP